LIISSAWPFSGDGGRDGEAVRAARLRLQAGLQAGQRHGRRTGLLAVERFELRQVDRFDIAADAALAETGAIHGSKCVISRGFTCGCVAR
jgi:hypothetical protein